MTHCIQRSNFTPLLRLFALLLVLFARVCLHFGQFDKQKQEHFPPFVSDFVI
ncbi:hypothetical protein HMPREF1581_01533 [Gardnerella vaginalis JCP8108]|uniref:Uncharacterized protein n=1 Tax=Gardnerella vaginalis JCP8108 TaxID=1261066 RepID=S4GBZ8_GARVA|nr:hypothetical protein HMPREF1581_01533 [Gardnerella vaginalis JCP8108]